MHDEHDSQDPALMELRERLRGGMARLRVNQTDLAQRAGLGRTTVSESLSSVKPAPSPETVAALARALRLPVEELLELRRSAVEGAGGGVRSVPGRSIGEWDPHDLEVHPAGDASGPGRSGARTMPGYVRREHDRVLAGLVEDAAAGRSRAVVLVGGSSTGKTRACWEAVQPLAAQGWRLWHPFDPTRAQDALEDLPRVAPRTVVWLNEAQHYLGDRVAGERIAAAVHRLLVRAECGPVLVLGTLWPEYAARYTALPAPGEQDPHSRVRELLAGRVLTVPETFDTPALAAAAALAEGGDRLLADALTRAGAGGRVTQDLAGAPELLNRYRHATPAAAAVLEAAMDARRLGVGLHLPQVFLTDAATDYLTDTEYDQLTDDWAEQAFAELATTVHGKQAPLRRTTPRTQRRPPAPAPAVDGPAQSTAGPMFRLADYLEQHGRTSRRHLCPPASFWHAAHTHLTDPDDLSNLTHAADIRQRLQWAHALRHRAADHGSTNALLFLALAREQAGDWNGAEAFYRQAAEHGSTDALLPLARMREQAGDRNGAEAFYRQAAEHGSTDALLHLALMREQAGDWNGAEDLCRQAVEHGDVHGLFRLARIREAVGDRSGAEAFYRQATERGHYAAPLRLAEMWEQAGDRDGVEALARQAAERGLPETMYRLFLMREAAGDQGGAEAFYRQAVEHTTLPTVYRLAEMRKGAGDLDGAETLYRLAADRGGAYALLRLAQMREEAGDLDGAETLYRQAADQDFPHALHRLAVMMERAGDLDGAEAVVRLAVDRGSTDALYHLAEMREQAGDLDGAEGLYRQAADQNPHDLVRLAVMMERAGNRDGAEAVVRLAADRGSTNALYGLALMREQAGDRNGAEALARQTADHGNLPILYLSEGGGIFTRLWPYGLDPDGTPTPPWQAPVSIQRSRHIPPGTS
ncbi:tetratricopeptide repeat protein [Streptomyces sp. NPDC001389]|uniref:tetratricopeptide repeat protein n=1 Tax=Streptomyces sp. NPDC001389 TaxID=3364569 RepID=UPI0036B411BD